MNIKPIKNEQDYQQALALVEPYFAREDELNEQELDFFDVMVTLIEAYEAKHYLIDPPTNAQHDPQHPPKNGY